MQALSVALEPFRLEDAAAAEQGEASKINEIGMGDPAKCKDGCRLGDGAGLPIGPAPLEPLEGEGFAGAVGSGAEGVVFQPMGAVPAAGAAGAAGVGGGEAEVPQASCLTCESDL